MKATDHSGTFVACVGAEIPPQKSPMPIIVGLFLSSSVKKKHVISIKSHTLESMGSYSFRCFDEWKWHRKSAFGNQPWLMYIAKATPKVTFWSACLSYATSTSFIHTLLTHMGARRGAGGHLPTPGIWQKMTSYAAVLQNTLFRSRLRRSPYIPYISV